MSTVNVNAIDKESGSELVLGGSGTTVKPHASATVSGFGLFASYAIIADQKSQNTDGGTATSGSWQTRDLNTEIADPDGIVSISANQFTLAAGSYLIKWAAPAADCAKHQSRLYDVTGTAVVEVGSSQYSYTDYDSLYISIGSARVTPSGSNVYRIEHRVLTTKADNGYGMAANFGTEMYTMVEIYKEA